MVNVMFKRRDHDGCSKVALCGMTGKKREFCAQHTTAGMMNVKDKRCGHGGWTKHPSSGRADGKVELSA